MCDVDDIGYSWGLKKSIGNILYPIRSAELLDAIANLFGVTFGIVVQVLIYFMIIHRNHKLMKLLFLYGMILTPLLLGLMFFNERPFVTLEDPIKGKTEKFSCLDGVVGSAMGQSNTNRYFPLNVSIKVKSQ